MTKNKDSRPASHATGQVTLEEIKAMSDEELKLEVAEIAGWSDIIRYRNTAVHLGYKPGRNKLLPQDPIPDYPSDLNAVHEVEKLLTPQQQNDYSFALCQLWMSDRRDTWRGVHATARQRCEALVLTLSPDLQNKRVTSISKEKDL